MYPVLVDFGMIAGMGPFRIHTYGVLLALGFLCGILLADRKAKAAGLDLRVMNDFYIVLILSSLSMARLFYVWIKWEVFAADPLMVFALWRGGLVFYGGLIGAFIGTTIYVRRFGLPWALVADIVAPSIAVGQFFGRIGCFCYGCCYGKASSAWYAVRFPGHAVARHPVQLYEVAGMACIFLLTHWLYGRQKRRGLVMATYLASYAALRFVLEFFRADYRGGSYLFGLSMSQSIALFAMVGALFWFAGLWREGREDRA